MGQFLCLHRVKTNSRPCPGRDYTYFCYSGSTVDKRLDTKLKPKRTVPFEKIFSAHSIHQWLIRLKLLACINYGSGLTPPTIRMHGMRYYYGTHTCISKHVYIHTYRTSSNLYTPDSVSLASLACQLEMCSVSTNGE